MSQAHLTTKDFDWTGELHKTIAHSLSTSFGLEFLLFDDKQGGDVDTIHNVRQGIHASKKERSAYENRGQYDSKKYHTNKEDDRYKKRGKADSVAQENGILIDIYRNKKMARNEKRDLDHVISAHEIDNDAGRILAGLDGVELANQDTNLNSTHRSINRSKREFSTEKFLNETLDNSINTTKNRIQETQDNIHKMPTATPQERSDKRDEEDRLRKQKERLKALEEIDRESMLKADKKARDSYNSQINQAYYTSSKFLKSSGLAAANTGLKMGARQGLGLILAEVWFELKELLPNIFNKCISNFKLETLFTEIKISIVNIWERIKIRFKDILTSFQDGLLGGILASISTTLMNIFLTSTKLIARLIRETWQSLVKAAKLVFFNPQSLSFGDLIREVTKILGFGAATLAGVLVNQQLNTILTIPFGDSIAAFLGATLTGVLTVGLTYFLDHSELMQKVWSFLNTIKSKYAKILEHYQEINAELDRYLIDLAKLEFNMNANELRVFNDSLVLTNDELERSIILTNEINHRNIELPFEMGNHDSTRKWLSSL